MFDRCDNKDNAVETAIGFLPKPGSISIPQGVTEATMSELIKLDVEGWKAEIADVRENHYSKFGDKLPKELYGLLDVLEKELNS